MRINLAQNADGTPGGVDYGMLKRIDELDRTLSELSGWRSNTVAVTEPDGTLRIVEHNCAILNVALRYGQACGTELSFIREVLPGADVERVQHLLDGSHVCAYEIRPR